MFYVPPLEDLCSWHPSRWLTFCWPCTWWMYHVAVIQSITSCFGICGWCPFYILFTQNREYSQFPTLLYTHKIAREKRRNLTMASQYTHAQIHTTTQHRSSEKLDTGYFRTVYQWIQLVLLSICIRIELFSVNDELEWNTKSVIGLNSRKYARSHLIHTDTTQRLSRKYARNKHCRLAPCLENVQ